MAISTVFYPSEVLPLPLLASFGYEHGNSIVRTEMDSGAARQRRRFLNAPSLMRATWSLLDDEFALLEGWLMHQVSDGADWFQMPVKTPLGMVSYDVRFTKAPGRIRPVSHNRWEVGAELEVRRRSVLDADLVAVLAGIPYQLDEWAVVLASLESTVNFNNLST